MHILFFEPEMRGHQVSYVNHLVRYLAHHRQDLRATFAVDPRLLNVLDGEARALLDPCAGGSVTALPLKPADIELSMRAQPWRRGLARWALVARLLGETGADHAHFLFADHVLLPLMLRRKMPRHTPVSGILFRPTVHYADLGGAAPEPREVFRDWRKAITYRAALANPCLARLFSFDPYFPAYAARRYGGGDRVVVLPDFAPLPDEVAEKDASALAGKLGRDRTVFLLFGALAERKGIVTVLQAARLLGPHIARSTAVLFAGRLDNAVRDRFLKEYHAVAAACPDLALHLEDRYLSDPELAGLVFRANVVLAPYHRNVGSSGILYWAAAAGKPIVTQDYGLVGRQTREYGLGLAIDTRNPAALADAITHAVETGPGELCRPEGQKAFCAGHSPEEFAKVIIDGISGCAL